MTDEENILSDEEKEDKQAQEAYEQLAKTTPSLEAEIPEEIGVHKSLEEVESSGGNASDLELTLRRLFPQFSNKDINDVAKGVMVGRITPDTVLDRIYLTVIAIAERHETVHLEEKDEAEIKSIIKQNLNKFPKLENFINFDVESALSQYEIIGKGLYGYADAFVSNMGRQVLIKVAKYKEYLQNDDYKKHVALYISNDCQKLFEMFADDKNYHDLIQWLCSAIGKIEELLNIYIITPIDDREVRYDIIQPTDEIDTMLIINLVTTAFEIGLDSKGRVDLIETHGASVEENDLEKLSNIGG